MAVKNKSNIFNSVKINPPKRNRFDLSHDVKTTFNMGQLIPVMAMECYPGDTHILRAQSLLRFAPLVAPIMHRVDVRVEYYFVPYRILWENWEDFITGKNTALVLPYIEYGVDPAWFPLGQRLKLPNLANPATNIRCNAFNFAAYQAIYNEYYRDQNLQAEINYKLVDGNNAGQAAHLSLLRNRCWEHDRFTSALPFAQKGSPVDIPLGEITADVVLKDGTPPLTPNFVINVADGSLADNVPLNAGIDPFPTGTLGAGANAAVIDPNGAWGVSGAVVPTTINDLRLAYALQRFYELDARAGTRYIELLKSMFGVISSDARLQRPEYIVGVKQPVIISEVLNTTGEVASGGLPQGNMSGHGISVLKGDFGKFNCEEHGVIMAVASVMPVTAYQQGIPREYLYRTREDFYWQMFDHLGEEAIMNQEVYAEHPLPLGTFGYTPRYSHLKFMNSEVAGQFRTTLNTWHLGRIFDDPPALNEEFVVADVSKRIFAAIDPNEDAIWCQIVHNIESFRPMSHYSTPI